MPGRHGRHVSARDAVGRLGGGSVLGTTVVNGLTIPLRQIPDYPGAAAGEAYSINFAGEMGSAVIAPTWNGRPLLWPQGRHDR